MAQAKCYHRADADHEVVQCPLCSVWTYRNSGDTLCPHCDNGNKDTWETISVDQVVTYNDMLGSLSTQAYKEADDQRRTILYTAIGIALVASIAAWFSPLGMWPCAIISGCFFVAVLLVKDRLDRYSYEWAIQGKDRAYSWYGHCFMSFSPPVSTDQSRQLTLERTLSEHSVAIKEVCEHTLAVGAQARRVEDRLYGCFIFVGLLIMLAGGCYYYFVWRVNSKYAHAIQSVKREHNKLIDETANRMRQVRLDDIILGSQAVNQLADALSSVDISQCPNRFQIEYLELTNRWRMLGQVLADNTGLKGMMAIFHDWTRLLNLFSLGSLERNEIDIQYRRLDAIADQYGVKFIDTRR